MRKGFLITLFLLIPAVAFSQIFRGKFTPKDGKTLLTIGQDLQSLTGYRNGIASPLEYDYSLKAGEGLMPEPGGVVAYVAFYLVTSTDFGINYGALGMDNSGSYTGIDTDWGAGPLNASSTALGWEQSTLVLAVGFPEHWNANGMSGIANGQFNANIDKLALFCNKFKNKRIYMRLGYEFDGRWNGPDVANYGTSNESPSKGNYHKVENYKAAYRKIVEGLRAKGVNNVAYVWQSCASSIDDVLDGWFDYNGDLAAAREDISDWYPGDDVVDWIGFSWFIAPQEADDNFGFADVPNLPNQDDLADEVLAFARQKHKPVMLSEATAQGYDVNFPEATQPNQVSRVACSWTYEGAKTLYTEGIDAAKRKFKAGTWFENLSAEQAWERWYKPFFEYVHKHKNIIRAVNYINADWNSQFKWSFNEEVQDYVEGYWGDTRVEANAVIKEKWLAETNNSDFWLLGSANINDMLEDVPTGISDDKSGFHNNMLKGFTLNQNFPNPIKTTTTIAYRLTQSTKVKISIHSIDGALLATLEEGHKPAGSHQIEWDATKLPSGVYLYKVTAGNFVKIKKCLVKK